MQVILKRAVYFRSKAMEGKSGMHVAPISRWEVEQAIEDAENHLFSRVYIYTDNKQLSKFVRESFTGIFLIDGNK